MALIAFLQTPVGQLVLLAIGYGCREGIAWILKQKRFAALSGVAQAASDAVTAAKAQLGSDAPPSEIRASAIAAAKATLIQDLPNIGRSLEAEAGVLLAGHVAQLTTAPGGATVVLPNLGATK
jgi:hypothetical protein